MFKYGLKERPVGMGCQPSRFRKYEDSSKDETGYWSFVWYERKLSDDDLDEYEMDYLGQE